MNRPTFSVLIPTRASSPYLAAALDSVTVAAEGAADIEILLVIDGPRELSPAVREGRTTLRVLRSPGSGISDALNAGIAAARAEYIVRMDDDDVCHPGRFTDLRRALWRGPDLIAGSVVTFGACRLRYERSARTTFRLRRNLLHRGYGIAHPATSIRRETLCAAGGYRREFDGAEDLDLWFRLLAAEVRYYASPRVHLYYRVHPNQSSRNPRRTTAAQVVGTQPDATAPCRRGCPGPLASLEAETGQNSTSPCPGYVHDLRYRELATSPSLSMPARWGGLVRRTGHLAVAEVVGMGSWWHEGRFAHAH